jgi:hypothetical protein
VRDLGDNEVVVDSRPVHPGHLLAERLTGRAKVEEAGDEEDGNAGEGYIEIWCNVEGGGWSGSHQGKPWTGTHRKASAIDQR